jgi:hypothetical protein
MAQRIKGQEVTLSFVTPEGSAEGLSDISSFEAELQMEILRERYLGETTDRRDDVFRGVSGSAELHLETQDYLVFTQRVQDRAERRSPAAGVFNATASFQFPNGQRPRITFENIFFGPLPIRVPESAGYVTVTIAWECERIRRVL